MNSGAATSCVVLEIPLNEEERQRAVDDLCLVDTPHEERFDQIIATPRGSLPTKNCGEQEMFFFEQFAAPWQA